MCPSGAAQTINGWTVRFVKRQEIVTSEFHAVSKLRYSPQSELDWSPTQGSRSRYVEVFELRGTIPRMSKTVEMNTTANVVEAKRRKRRRRRSGSVPATAASRDARQKMLRPTRVQCAGRPAKSPAGDTAPQDPGQAEFGSPGLATRGCRVNCTLRRTKGSVRDGSEEFDPIAVGVPSVDQILVLLSDSRHDRELPAT